MSNTISLQNNLAITISSGGFIGINNPNPQAPLDIIGGYVAGSTGIVNGSTFVVFHNGNFANSNYGTSVDFSSSTVSPTGGLQVFTSGKSVSGFYVVVNSGTASLTVDYIAWSNNN